MPAFKIESINAFSGLKMRPNASRFFAGPPLSSTCMSSASLRNSGTPLIVTSNECRTVVIGAQRKRIFLDVD